MNSFSTNIEACAAYIQYFENMTPATIDDIDYLSNEHLYFEDPFNKLFGRTEVKRLFRQMFEHMDDPAFKVSTIYWNENGDLAILKWKFTGNAKKIGTVDFEGVSEIRFDPAHDVVSHIDYWDAAAHFYERIPIIGFLLRLIKKSIRLS